jgi:hypothetical protein
MLRLLSEHYPGVAAAITGLLLIFWPPPKHSEREEERQRRLAELRSGAPERYFEERRQLEAYGPDSAGPFRFWGVLLLFLSIAIFITGQL